MNTTLLSQILDSVEKRRNNIITDLSSLVACDSTLGHEAAAQSVIKQVFLELGTRVSEITIDLDKLSSLPGFSPPVTNKTDGRTNIVGVHTPKEATGRSLILNGHMDVVPSGPAHLWNHPPFEPYVDGDWLYGRGSGDMKAGIVAYCNAFAALKDLGYQPAAKVILQSVIEEECTGNGALACLDAGYTADAAIIPEPFGQTCLVAQLGVMWFQLKLTGKPAHVLDTSSGSNVFDALYLIINRLKALESEWNQTDRRHHCYASHAHPINFNLGKVHGGDWASTVACYCEADFRVGFYPGMKLDDIKNELEQVIASVELPNDLKAELCYTGFQAEGCEINKDAPLIESVKEAHRLVSDTHCETLAVTATTDCRFFQLYGNTPATCYGPVAENIHGFNERVSVSSTVQVAQVLAVFIANWCGLEKTG
ncbi:N-formyl-4-amino-5-aminomethyl-2-methylpyrimidinedeformylase [Vibrio aerogenes CECT 7868]|uniref:N-formyl-4-amino-5-aminomethyl-2-methylpyrimidine deformylase n=1 Tax=Vibrio aerogenes CECT 7868 TaxID=1216006 RepID=A0A1M6AHB3_9VIBR|nr:ArgE/DapE family deacylase [Vibrio aerogenes]SHI35910.1 N-formyl-4-amino-5-aminomethyl-2-methylpyrimidinedeformylase [Vibrio aerogenes CECT 7868]